MARVLVIATWYPSAQVPTQAVFNRQHVQVLARDHQVQVFHVRLGSRLPDSDELDSDGPGSDGPGSPVRVHRRSFDPRSPRAALRTLRELRDYARGADYIHTMAFSSALLGAAVWPRAPWVHTEHWSGMRDPTVGPRAWRYVAWVRHVLRAADAVAGVTPELTGVLRRFAAPGATVTVPCLVEGPAQLTPIPTGDTFDMVAVGRLDPGKDPQLAVRVLARLGELGVRARLTWVGAGSEHDAVTQLAADLGVSDRLVLAGGRPHAEVAGYLARAQVFFLPTRYENFFVSAAEALAAGRPVVVGATGGHGAHLTGPGCELVAQQDITAYTDALLRMRARIQEGQVDPAMLAAPIVAQFGLGAVAAALREAYELANGRRGWRPHALRFQPAQRPRR